MAPPSTTLKAVVIRTADALARTHTDAAIDTLTSVMGDEMAKDSDRIKAAAEILDRGHGKPLSATIVLPVTQRMVAQLTALEDDELLRIATSSVIAEVPAGTFDFEAACAALPQLPKDDDDDDDELLS